MPLAPQRDAPARRSVRFGLVPWAVSLLLAYVLSVGPAVVLHARLHSKPLESGLRVIYLPVVLLAEHSPPAEKVLAQYVEWWLRVTGTTLWG